MLDLLQFEEWAVRRSHLDGILRAFEEAQGISWSMRDAAGQRLTSLVSVSVRQMCASIDGLRHRSHQYAADGR